MSRSELLFDLIESEAQVNIFFDRKDFTAKGAAIIVTSSPVGHFPKKKSDKYTLWFGRGIERETFSSRKQAYERTVEMLKKINATDIVPRIEGRDAKAFQKIWDHQKEANKAD